MYFSKRIIALICAITIVCFSVVPSFAQSSFGEYSPVAFWDFVFNHGFGGGERPGDFGAGGFGGSLPDSWSSADDMKTAYSDYVSSLPSSGYDSSGALIWQPRWIEDTKYWFAQIKGPDNMLLSSDGAYVKNDSSTFVSLLISGSCMTLHSQDGHETFFQFFLSRDHTFTAPIVGKYTCIKPGCIVGSYVDTGGKLTTDKESLFTPPSAALYSAGDAVPAGKAVAPQVVSSGYITSGEFYFYTPVYSIVPADQQVIANNYYINTRVNNFNGDYYNSVTNNYYDNTTIVNETTNNYYDMTTNTNYTMKQWSYDYESRTYFITLEDGTTVTVQFSDDSLIITSNDVTNSYQYVIKNNGGSNPDIPAACKHDWQETIDVAPTCLESGHASYTCSKCGETYEQILAAKGHDWKVLEHVNTVYNSDGTVITQGHTLYQCSVCGEQFYTDTGAPPPDVSVSGAIIAWLNGFQAWLDAKFQLCIDKLQIVVDNSQTNIDNVTNVVIDQTNNAYHVFYLTGEDGTEHSIGEATGGMLSASGKLLNFLYRLCVEGALSKVDDSIDGMSGFYFDSNTGTEGSIWD